MAITAATLRQWGNRRGCCCCRRRLLPGGTEREHFQQKKPQQLSSTRRSTDDAKPHPPFFSVHNMASIHYSEQRCTFPVLVMSLQHLTDGLRHSRDDTKAAALLPIRLKRPKDFQMTANLTENSMLHFKEEEEERGGGGSRILNCSCLKRTKKKKKCHN